MMNQLNTFDQVVGQLQVQINELSSWISTPTPTRLATPTALEEVTNITTITAAKSEKLPDPLMFNEDWKELHLFVTKLHLKLSENANQFLMNRNKINYAMSHLENDAAQTMNSFYQNDMFCTLDLFILLLEQTYDNVSCKHNAATKLEKLWQQNHKFISFFSKFLDLVKELEWNKIAKINTLK